MTHRADQIIDAIVTAISAQVYATGVKVFAHRRYSLAADQDELPAISVDFGEDNPVDVDETGGYFDSLLSVPITSIVALPEEADVRAELLDLRRQSHIALMSDRTVGLSFVINTHYGGAEPPEIDVDGDLVVGSLTGVWIVYYRMNISDPGD